MSKKKTAARGARPATPKTSPWKAAKDKPAASSRARAAKTEIRASGPERLQKYLATHGYGSRRQAEEWIESGRIEVNGEAVALGTKVTTADRITLDGRRLSFTAPQAQTIIYRKRIGEIVTRRDPEGRPSVFKRLPKLDAGRWISVGRLDINTSGILLFTTDGELARRLMHPSTGVEREYAVRVLGEVTPQMLQRLRDGIELEDGPAAFDHIVDMGGEGANHWYHVTVREGRNRIVRRLWEAIDVQVSRLIRVRFGPIVLPENLASGQSRPLTHAEQRAIKALLKAADQ